MFALWTMDYAVYDDNVFLFFQNIFHAICDRFSEAENAEKGM